MSNTLEEKTNQIKAIFSVFNDLTKDPTSILESKPFGFNSWQYKVCMKEVPEYSIELLVIGYNGSADIELATIKEFRLISGFKSVQYILSVKTAMKFIKVFILSEQKKLIDYTDVEI